MFSSFSTMAAVRTPTVQNAGCSLSLVFNNGCSGVKPST